MCFRDNKMNQLFLVALLHLGSFAGFINCETTCVENSTFVWCLPPDYNMAKHPFLFTHLVNQTLPQNYDFEFVVEEISNINDKAQTISISMYFGVSWLEPRLVINEEAEEWTEIKTGPPDEINVSPEVLSRIWYPELEIYGLEKFGRQRVLKEMSGVRVRKNKTINYELGVQITVSCKMLFDDYPLDAHTCTFQVGSYYDTEKTVQCRSKFTYEKTRQRSLQHLIQFEELPEEKKSISLPSGDYSACGFQIQLQRKTMQLLVQVYLPSFMFVIVSWISYLVKPEVVPGRMALLVTLFLVLINIFNSVRERAPISTSLNAVDLYLVVCIFLVFGALMEYGLVLFLLMKRMSPKYIMSQISCTQKFEEEAPHEPEEQKPLNDELSPRTRKRTPKAPELRPAPPQTTVELCHDIDVMAFWVSAPMFLVFNLAYWITYLNYDYIFLNGNHY